MLPHPEHAAAALQNFDLEVEKARKRLKTRTEDDCMSFELRSETFISMLPEGVRNLTVKEFLSRYQGRVDLFQKASMENTFSGLRNETNAFATAQKHRPDFSSRMPNPMGNPPAFISRLPETPLCQPQRFQAPTGQYSVLAPRRFTFMDNGFVEGDFPNPLSNLGTSGITIPWTKEPPSS
ncbi:hypothetical protein BC829DRAFT_490863, partial [Chytridium lagenaria]